MFIWAKNHALLRVIYNISDSLWRLRVLAETSVIGPETSGGERGRERRKSLVWEKKKGRERRETDRKKARKKKGKRKQKEKEKKKGAEQKEKCEGSSGRLFSKPYSPQLCFQFINTVNWMDDDITK